MNLSDRVLRLAFLGMGHDPEDIIDYVAEWSSVIVSLVLGIGVAICIGKFLGAWMAPIAGVGAYAIGVAFGNYAFLRRHAEP